MVFYCPACKARTLTSTYLDNESRSVECINCGAILSTELHGKVVSTAFVPSKRTLAICLATILIAVALAYLLWLIDISAYEQQIRAYSMPITVACICFSIIYICIIYFRRLRNLAVTDNTAAQQVAEPDRKHVAQGGE